MPYKEGAISHETAIEENNGKCPTSEKESRINPRSCSSLKDELPSDAHPETGVAEQGLKE